MPTQLGPRRVQFPSVELGELRDANESIDDVEALRERLEDDGYLLIRDLIPRDRVLGARSTVLAFLNRCGALAPDRPVADAVIAAGTQPPVLHGRTEITHDPEVRPTLENERLFDLFGRLFGTAALTLDFKWLRATVTDEFTGAHCDAVYMSRGSPRLLTCWIPIGDIEVDQSTLAICVGSHRLDGFAPLRSTYGRLDVDRDDTEGWFTTDPLEVTEHFGGRWKTTSFSAGDVLIFGMQTLHASTTNLTDRYRLTCDVRFQPANEPVDERWVGTEPEGHPGYPWRRTMREARTSWGL